MSRHTQTLVAGATPIAALATVPSLPTLAVSYAAQGPGPVFDILSDVRGKNIISVSGSAADSERSKGTLDMTAVAVRHNLTLLQVISLWFDRNNDIVPIEAVFPPSQSQDEVEGEDKAAFTESGANATSATLAHLGLPMEVTIAYIMPDSPVDGWLHEDDVVLAVGGMAVSKPEQVKVIVTGRNPGNTVTLRVRPTTVDEQKTAKDENSDPKKAVDISVTLVENPHQKNTALLGVGMRARSVNDTKVEYQLSGIGGPSAGPMVMLGVIDKLSPDDLTEGQRLAGTGTISAIGNIGEIGGITHKISTARDGGAEIFLVPEDNCTEAVTAGQGGMKLVEVSVPSDALAAIEKPEAAQTCS